MDTRSDHLSLTPNKSHYQKGFTLVELIIVILILGVLSATALPRFININDDALIAKHRDVATQFKSVINAAHSVWLLEGGDTQKPFDTNDPNKRIAVNLEVYDNVMIKFNDNGWPVDTYDHGGFEFPFNCYIFLERLLKNITASHQNANAGVDYFARQTPSVTGCRYELNKNRSLSFSYESTDGTVTVDDVID